MFDCSEPDAEGGLGGLDFGEGDFAVDWFDSFEVGLVSNIEFAAVCPNISFLYGSLRSSCVVVGLEIDVQVLLVLLDLFDFHV